MGLFSKFVGKKVASANAGIAKVEKRDLMQAIIGGMVLIAGADGELEPSELDRIEKVIRSNKSLEHFGSEITETMNRFKEQLEAGFRVARMHILREIREIKGNPNDAEEVFVNMITIAEADGEIEESEKKVLIEVGRELGLRLQDFGLEG